MNIPIEIVAIGAILIVVLAVAALSGLAAWYGILCEREDERAALLRGEWQCDECGRSLRFVRQTVTLSQGGDR